MECLELCISGIRSYFTIVCVDPHVCLALQPPLPGHGQGRISILDQPISVATAIEKMKAHLGMKHLRLALGVRQTLGT